MNGLGVPFFWLIKKKVAKWLLAGGIWRDRGIWDDTATWED